MPINCSYLAEISRHKLLILISKIPYQEFFNKNANWRQHQEVYCK